MDNLASNQDVLLKLERTSAYSLAYRCAIHDIQRPLDHLLDIVKDTNDSQFSKELVTKQTHKIKNILKTIQIFSSEKIIINKDSIPADRLLREALAHLTASMVMKNISLVSDIDKKILLAGDFSLLSQALENILENAVQASYPNEILEVRVKELDHTHVISISNRGKDIPFEKMQKIFDPLYTDKPNGTGLGLYIVKKIINAHQGQTKIHSNDQITTVEISLPKSKAEISQHADENLLQFIKIKDADIVYWIDDDPFSFEAQKSNFKHKNIIYHLKADDDLLNTIFQKSQSTNVVVITDYFMQDNMNGFQFALNLKSKNKNIPVFLCSHTQILEDEKYSFDGFIAKI